MSTAETLESSSKPVSGWFTEGFDIGGQLPSLLCLIEVRGECQAPMTQTDLRRPSDPDSSKPDYHVKESLFEASKRHRPDGKRRSPMIERYSDHAANERTFLAWVRTAIAIMAFGFLVQKFDLFLRIASASLTARTLPQRSPIVGDIAGLLLIVLGGAMMVLAAVRFRKTTLDIDAKEVRLGPGTQLDIILAALLFLLGAILFVYLSYTVIGRL